MKTDTPKTIYLKDYAPYPYEIESLDLNFDIRDGHTDVTAKIKFLAKENLNMPIQLNGEDLETLEIKRNGFELEDNQYDIQNNILTIEPTGNATQLEIKTRIYPEQNTRLEGLYNSGGTYCTQCEAEGFRRITFYPDRPDVMTTFTVRLEADQKHPVLLSNGNKTDEGKLDHGRHYSVWHDPFPKPCYLFALVAGSLTHIHDTFKTKSGRIVDLYIYVRPGDEDQCAHAMDSLKKSMTWDEETYGLEYDLDIFNIVAVSDFNMGAMENKSLNIFNTALVLAHQETATDTDFMRVESVIAHEYFHNWSGNRVTCRDWFQLSLKEGLTVFRDQEFSSDMHSRSVQRIDDVIHLRNFQFTEDAGPLAHPIRPDNYIEINNFYTMTVYEKGAEVIRMLRTILGPENYRKGTDLYFKRHDGQAVTCDDFVKALEDASNIDLAQFKLWYSQAGTPQVTFKGKYDTEKKTYKIELSQKTLPTPGQSDKAPMSIPVTIGLLNSNGDDITEETLLLTQKSQSFEMTNIASPPTPSILRNFSSPVKLTANYTQEEMQFLMLHDSDGFNRWEAAQRYFLRTLGKMIETRSPLPETFVKIYGDLLKQALNPQADNALIARAISLPYYPGIFQEQKIVDPDAVYKAREEMLNTIVGTHSDLLTEIYNAKRTAKEFSVSPESMGRRTLQNTVMLILSNKRTKEDALRAIEHYDSANNMTDRMAALNMMCAYDGPEHTSFLNAFYERYKSHELVVNKWFSAQAMVVRGDSLEIIQRLRAHEEFDIKNPNRVRALYAAFAMNNPVVFHQANGAGYTFLRDAVIELNTINPQIAARLLAPMREWKRYTPARQEKMEDALREILKTPNLAPDIYEITSKSLEN